MSKRELRRVICDRHKRGVCVWFSFAHRETEETSAASGARDRRRVDDSGRQALLLWRAEDPELGHVQENDRTSIPPSTPSPHIKAGALQTVLKLEQVWADVEKDLEANLLVFLERLFLLQPSAVLPLRTLEQSRVAHTKENGGHAAGTHEPSLSLRIKVVANHFGRAVRLAARCGPLPLTASVPEAAAAALSAELSSDAWHKLAPGFRSLARSFAGLGWGCKFASSLFHFDFDTRVFETTTIRCQQVFKMMIFGHGCLQVIC